jgi:hypothetical protein
VWCYLKFSSPQKNCLRSLHFCQLKYSTKYSICKWTAELGKGENSKIYEGRICIYGTVPARMGLRLPVAFVKESLALYSTVCQNHYRRFEMWFDGKNCWMQHIYIE